MAKNNEMQKAQKEHDVKVEAADKVKEVELKAENAALKAKVKEQEAAEKARLAECDALAEKNKKILEDRIIASEAAEKAKAKAEAENAANREKKITKELKTPLTADDQTRIAELEAKANAHGDYLATASEMLELGRLRKRVELK